jgi:hypothetical protein
MYQIRQYESDDTRKKVHISSVNGIIDEWKEKWLIHLSKEAKMGSRIFLQTEGVYRCTGHVEAIHRQKMTMKLVEGLSLIRGKQQKKKNETKTLYTSSKEGSPVPETPLARQIPGHKYNRTPGVKSTYR